MSRFYADEQFPYAVVEHLRNFGHDVLTVQEAGMPISKFLTIAFLILHVVMSEWF